MSTISTKDRPITIDQAIDDLDITPTAFRVYLHLLRLEITNPGEDVNLQAVADHCFRHTAQRCQGREGMSAESRFEKSSVQRLGCPLNGGVVARLAVGSLLSRALVNEQTSVFKAGLGESVLFAEIDVV